jgi:hypothetical protein
MKLSAVTLSALLAIASASPFEKRQSKSKGGSTGGGGLSGILGMMNGEFSNLYSFDHYTNRTVS